MATIKDVARETGTSISTVSKALNGSYTISEGTAAQVKEAAERLGYRPNARAQTFARRATRSAVFLTAMGRNTAFENPHMFEILAGAEKSLREKGYALTLRSCDTKDACAIVRDIMDSQAADGLLVHATAVTRELSLMLNREDVPHIVIGKPDFPNSLCWIDNNNQLAGELAARHLLERGIKKIAFIGGCETDKISEDRLAGAQGALEDTEFVGIFKGESSIAEGERMGGELLTLREPVEAVICANNHLALGCLREVQSRGVKVPEDLSLITFDDYPFAKYTCPPLTTVSIDVYDLGMQAGKLLVSRIKKPGLHMQSFTTLPILVRRQSVTATE